MKYSENNKPLICMQTQSTCYKGTGRMTVRGVLWHSTGCNNPNIRRYVQPDDNAPDREKLLAIIGKNTAKNDWNHIYRKAGLNCWIGKLADGTVSTVQTMPWDYKPWGCGNAYKDGPSCNDGWIQFEICEDGLNNADYFNKVYKEACEITAYLCKMFGIDPNGTVTYAGKEVPTILCHSDSYKLQLGSNHGDVMHWFPKYGKSMETARADVTALLAEASKAEQTKEPAQTTQEPQNEAKETTVDKMIWDFLKGHNLSDFAVAGIMGNLYAESGLRANNLQNSFEKKLGMSDEAYTAAVDNGSYTNFVKDSAGYGLAQWTYWSRKQALLNFAKAQGKSIGDIQMQLDYLWKELSGYKGVMTQLKNAKSVLEASNAILTGYEKPADQSAAVQKKRAGYGQTFYDLYAETFKPYTVRVTASALNVRKGPGTSNPVTTVIRDKGIYTIVEEKAVGKNTWGRLKSGAGWICLYYTKKV